MHRKLARALENTVKSEENNSFMCRARGLLVFYTTTNPPSHHSSRCTDLLFKSTLLFPPVHGTLTGT